MSDSKHRNYVFTINNPTKATIKSFDNVARSLDSHVYTCYSIEYAPSTGTKHIQGYIQLSSPQRFLYLHGYFNLTQRGKKIKFHIEPAKGTFEQNRDYIAKSSELIEYGEPKTQGKRTDLIEIKKKIADDPSKLHDIVRSDCNNYQQLRFAESLQQYYYTDRDPSKPPAVYWISGKSGIGKTSMVYRDFDGVCNVSQYNWLGTGYQQQQCLLLDDFREHDLSFNQLLKLTDRYPFQLFFKGGSIPLNSPYIVITSSKTIDQMYDSLNDDVSQLKRRVIEIDLNHHNVKDLKSIKEDMLSPQHERPESNTLDFDDPNW